MTKNSIHKEDTTIVNIYILNIRALNMQILTDLKGETDSNTIIVGDFNTPLSIIDRSSSQRMTHQTETTC